MSPSLASEAQEIFYRGAAFADKGRVRLPRFSKLPHRLILCHIDCRIDRGFVIGYVNRGPAGVIDVELRVPHMFAVALIARYPSHLHFTPCERRIAGEQLLYSRCLVVYIFSYLRSYVVPSRFYANFHVFSIPYFDDDILKVFRGDACPFTSVTFEKAAPHSRAMSCRARVFALLPAAGSLTDIVHTPPCTFTDSLRAPAFTSAFTMRSFIA